MPTVLRAQNATPSVGSFEAALGPELPEESEEFEKYVCQQCKAKIEHEPRCETCKRCALCCDCKYCASCDVRCRPCPACLSCKEHCTCWSCEACNKKHKLSVKTCTNCMACKDQCICWTCGGCERFFSRWRTRHIGMVPCARCSLCVNCCAKGAPLGARCRVNHLFSPAKPTFHTAIPLSLRVKNRSGRLLSSEIEVAGTVGGSNVLTAVAVAKWGGGIVRDGSLPEGGFEINTAPAGGDKFLEEIDEICAGLKADGAATDRSCGAHLHIDARDFTPYDLRRVIYLYEKIETAIFHLVAAERRDNRYCIPCGARYVLALRDGTYLPKDKKKPTEAAKAKHAIIKGLYGHEPGADMKQIRHDKYNGSRYNALNLHSWMYRGTVECRVLHGTVDPVEIQNWGMMWATIMDYARRAKEADIKELRGTSPQILDSVVGESRPDIVGWMVAQRKRFRGKASPHPTEPGFREPLNDDDEDGDCHDVEPDDDD